MTEPVGEEFVLGLPDRLRLYAKLYPSVQITLSAENAHMLAADLERGIAHRPGQQVVDAVVVEPEPEPAQNILQRVAKYLLTKDR
jgi:divalent metal cation (Fe/Co/Zn/Cd) transporter